jgi:hypothetical protein
VEEFDSLTWVVRPSVRIRRRLPLIAAVLAVTFFCALILFHSLIFALAAVALVFVPNAAGILPLTYTLSPQGARVSVGPITWLEMNWRNVRSTVSTKAGLKLSAYDNPATAVLESRRGIALAYPPDMAQRVEAAVADFRAQAAREART